LPRLARPFVALSRAAGSPRPVDAIPFESDLGEAQVVAVLLARRIDDPKADPAR
jgi:hypothetical protein